MGQPDSLSLGGWLILSSPDRPDPCGFRAPSDDAQSFCSHICHAFRPQLCSSCSPALPIDQFPHATTWMSSAGETSLKTKDQQPTRPAGGRCANRLLTWGFIKAQGHQANGPYAEMVGNEPADWARGDANAGTVGAVVLHSPFQQPGRPLITSPAEMCVNVHPTQL